MPRNTDWLVIGFAGEAGCPRIEVVMRASDRRHADRLAADLADDDGSAIVLSPHHSFGRRGFRVERKFGHVPPEGELQSILPGCLISDEPRTGRDGLHRNRRNVYRGAGLAMACAALVTVSVTAMRASAAQRETRLMELARPHCGRDAMTNKHLHQIVHHASALTDSKHDAFHLIIAVCRSGVG
jgi:hypothetical protein